jgi:predicted phosphodiesterase
MSTETNRRAVRIALFSDVHANLPAMEAVLADIDGQNDLGAVYHIGDLVGYAPWPNEVVDLLRARGITGVAGNYDSTTATAYEHCGCKYEDPRQAELAHLSYAWTLEHTSPDSKRFLGALPFRLDVRPFGGHIGGPRLILVHGNPTLNTVYWTEDRPESFAKQMAAQAGAQAGDVIAFGHTHMPWHKWIDGVHFVNTGSVGRPKDGDPRAGYVVLTFEGDTVAVAFVRVEYYVERAMSGIRSSDLPDDFAEYLRTGGVVAPSGEKKA